PRPPQSTEPQPADATQPATAHVDDMLAALRREQRQPELRPNALLAKVAREHAERVCQSGVVAHELERGANPEQRLLAAGIRARRVGETVARAAGAETAFAAFEHSPSHRLTLLERGFTDVGVGQSTDSEQRHCVVVLLAEWPRFVGR
ncbi:MAG TPA: CAP domain-containing protein, partial [Polyangiales bacterium]|nr:CAP domain-containing protein [Polyangiales bacterium]